VHRRGRRHRRDDVGQQRLLWDERSRQRRRDELREGRRKLQHRGDDHEHDRRASQLSFSYEGGGKVASGTLTVYDNAGTCSAFGVAEYS
jgi:hypothetical protein